jgi:hypothetical protein
MRHTNQVILNFNNNLSTAAVLLDIEKTFAETWHFGLLYKLSTLKFSINLIKPIGSFVSHRKFRVSVESELSTPRNTQASVPLESVLFRALYILYINDTPQTPGVYLGLLSDDFCMYETDRKRCYSIRKLQGVLSAIATWRERWVTNINEDKTQSIHFSHRFRFHEDHLI